MKTILAVMGLILAAAPAMAQMAPMRAIDLNAPLADARLGLAWNTDGVRLGVAYVPVIYLVGKDTGREYATVNLGASSVLKNGKTSYVVSAGPRIDTVFAKLGETAFAKKYLRFAVLPPLQISPTLMTSDFKKFTWWLTIASKFGGK